MVGSRASKQSLGSGTLLTHKVNAHNIRILRPQFFSPLVCDKLSDKLSAAAKPFCPSPPQSQSPPPYLSPLGETTTVEVQSVVVHDDYNKQKGQMWNKQADYQMVYTSQEEWQALSWSSEAVWGVHSGNPFLAPNTISISNSTSFIVQPSVPCPEDRYAYKAPSGIIVQTTSGQQIEFWSGVHVPKSMFDISSSQVV
jgi:hypothetical protein